MGIENKMSSYNEKGEEIPDSRPTELAINFKAPQPLEDRIHQLVTGALIQRDLEAAGIETFDEADDFEMDDLDPTTPYEENFDPLHIAARNQEIRHGFVKDIPPDVIAKARELIAKADAVKLKAEVKAKATKKPEPSTPEEEK